MFCNKCGNKLSDDSCFCQHCGVKINSSADSDTKKNVNVSSTDSLETLLKILDRFSDFKSKFIYIFKMICSVLKKILSWSEISTKKILLLFIISISSAAALGTISSVKYYMDFQSSYKEKKSDWLSSSVNTEYQAIKFYEKRENLQKMNDRYERNKGDVFKDSFCNGFILSLLITTIIYYLKLFLKTKNIDIKKLKSMLLSTYSKS